MSAPAISILSLIPRSARDALSVLGARIDARATGYSLRRSRAGAVVWLHVGKLSINLNVHMKHNPGDFSAARLWMTQISDALGYHVPERRKRPRPVLRVITGGKASI